MDVLKLFKKEPYAWSGGVFYQMRGDRGAPYFERLKFSGEWCTDWAFFKSKETVEDLEPVEIFENFQSLRAALPRLILEHCPEFLTAHEKMQLIKKMKKIEKK